MKEAKLRMEDALAATRAAVEEGIISRWRFCLYSLCIKEGCQRSLLHLDGDEKTGANVVLKALEAPLHPHRCKCRTGRRSNH